ncbi:hypothetical protein BJV78DRAFT_1353659 [Lactifluus subvellereus]|nr:hypothetical protein BJV78DRAFT_1353659 [Lactifluus subvellereus]
MAMVKPMMDDNSVDWGVRWRRQASWSGMGGMEGGYAQCVGGNETRESRGCLLYLNRSGKRPVGIAGRVPVLVLDKGVWDHVNVHDAYAFEFVSMAKSSMRWMWRARWQAWYAASRRRPRWVLGLNLWGERAKGLLVASPDTPKIGSLSVRG